MKKRVRRGGRSAGGRAGRRACGPVSRQASSLLGGIVGEMVCSIDYRVASLAGWSVGRGKSTVG
eukprot:5636357-Pleurochrysis_carterae.AAC.1